MKIKQLFKKYFSIILLILVLISYGQLLLMQPWEDDNALFFKLANIEGAAGFLGEGPFGEGVYRYTATPYIPIYTLFGHNSVAYFALALFFYFLTTAVVYKIFAKVLNPRAGQIAGFLFACGYIAADGFVRLFNTIITSISIIGISFLAYFYWLYYKERRIHWYFLSLATFFLVNEFARSRTHYLIFIIVAFEILLLSKKTNIFGSIRNSILRLTPFLYIFYRFFIVGADARSGNIKTFLESILKGDFYYLYGWLVGLANVTIPDWVSELLFKLQSLVISHSSVNLPYAWLIGIFSLALSAFLLLKGTRGGKIFSLGFFIILILWAFIAKQIFTTPALVVGSQQIFVAFLGGGLFLLSFLIILIIPSKFRPLFTIFWFWTIINIGAYSAYNPTLAYQSFHRYLAHSFFAVIGMLSVLIATLPEKLKASSRIIFALIILWGAGNLISGFVYQRNIVEGRSNPTRNFYHSLKSYLPQIKKGDVLYFDVKDSARDSFNSAFSVAQMPEETAIAWRYGLDRYDIRRLTKFEDLMKLIKDGSFTDKNRNKVVLNNIYSFFYTDHGLVNTTDDTRNALAGQGTKQVVFSGKQEAKDELTVVLNSHIKSVTPTELELNLAATILDPKELNFPMNKNSSMAKNSVAKNEESRQLAFAYQRFKQNFYQNVAVSTSSQWQDNVSKNLIDNNPDTFWRADRVLWSSKRAEVTLDLREIVELDKFIWINALSSSTPSQYLIQTSMDGLVWQDAKQINDLKRIDNKDPQVVSFTPIKARFAKMVINKTSNGDSPGIAAVWVAPTTFTKLDIKDTEQFLNNPFGFVPSQESYQSSLKSLDLKGFMQVYWQGDKYDSWTSDAVHQIKVVYDGTIGQYKIVLPAGGTRIDSLKLVVREIPGKVTVTNITARSL